MESPTYRVRRPPSAAQKSPLVRGAYGTAQAPGGYLPAGEAEARVGAFVRAVAAGAAWEDSLFNALEGPGFRKFIALPVLLGQLRARFGLAPRMSGSGSACFALLPDGAPVPEIVAAVRAAWGATALVVETRLA